MAALLFIVVGTLAQPASAAAAKPSTETFVYDLEFEGSIDCGDFTDEYVDRYHIREVDSSDAEGNLLQVIYYATHTSDDMNSVTGYTLHEHGHFREVDDFVKGTITVTGNQEIVNVPGKGIVIQDTGRLVLDANFEPIFFAGGRKHSQVLLGEEIWCDALR